jgi:hypothetical protein
MGMGGGVELRGKFGGEKIVSINHGGRATMCKQSKIDALRSKKRIGLQNAKKRGLSFSELREYLCGFRL